MSEDELPDPLRASDPRPSGGDIVNERKEEAQPQNQLPSTEKVTLGSGDNSMQAEVRSGSALYRALVLLLGMIGASAWVWAAGDAVDGAPWWLALVVVFGPAAGMLAACAYIGLHSARKHSDRLYSFRDDETQPPPPT